MTTTTLTVAEFLLQRLAEDEAAARAAISADCPDWVVRYGTQVETAEHHPGADVFDYTIAFDEGAPSEAQAAHIARHDPARVLAQAAAVRAIVESAEFAEATPSIHSDARVYMRNVLRHLAAAFADHPDFDPSWRPA